MRGPTAKGSGRGTLIAAIFAAVAASIAAVAAIVAVGFAWVGMTINEGIASGTVKPGYEAVCVAYSDFVLNQAHNGYTAEQIQQVVDFAGSHSVMPGEADEFHMPNRWPSISDGKACGTPGEIIEQAKPSP